MSYLTIERRRTYSILRHLPRNDLRHTETETHSVLDVSKCPNDFVIGEGCWRNDQFLGSGFNKCERTSVQTTYLDACW